MQADQKGLKQAKYVIDYLNSWKGMDQHTMSDVQAAITSAVALSSLGEDTKIADSDPCNVAVLGPTLVSIGKKKKWRASRTSRMLCRNSRRGVS